MPCSLAFRLAEDFKVKFLHCNYNNVKTMQILLTGMWLNKKHRKKGKVAKLSLQGWI